MTLRAWEYLSPSSRVSRETWSSSIRTNFRLSKFELEGKKAEYARQLPGHANISNATCTSTTGNWPTRRIWASRGRDPFNLDGMSEMAT